MNNRLMKPIIIKELEIVTICMYVNKIYILYTHDIGSTYRLKIIIKTKYKIALCIQWIYLCYQSLNSMRFRVKSK